MHVEPLDVADAGRQLHLLLALDEAALDVSALRADGDADFIEADAGIAGGMFREEGKEAVALRNAGRDGAPPVVAEGDVVFVKPDIVAALFQVSVDAADEFFVGVVSVAEEDAEGSIH